MKDVPLSIAMLTWNPAPRDPGALVVAHPERDGETARYGRSAGACWASISGADHLYDWPRMSETERMAMLLSSAWQAVVRDGVPAGAMHEALSVIPEYRVWMTPDMFRHLDEPEMDYHDEAEID